MSELYTLYENFEYLYANEYLTIDGLIDSKYKKEYEFMWKYLNSKTYEINIAFLIIVILFLF